MTEAGNALGDFANAVEKSGVIARFLERFVLALCSLCPLASCMRECLVQTLLLAQFTVQSV